MPDLKDGARVRLEAVRGRIAEIRSELARHEEAIARLKAQLPDLEFEEAAMAYILGGSAPPAERRKVDRQELIALIEEHMRSVGRPVEVTELHEHLDRQVDLGSNARNYLCGILSKGKDRHFANVGKGLWWLAGHPVP